MLAHTAPMLNSADTAVFAAIPENTPIGSNTGETVSTLLATGGAIVNDQPLGANFLSLDTANGAQEGIAVAGLSEEADGTWQYSINGGG
jgi:hypothetical protein